MFGFFKKQKSTVNIDVHTLKTVLSSKSKSAVHLLATKSPVRSKIGGQPNAHSTFSWPLWNEKLLQFLAQLDLAELAPHAMKTGLPLTGALYFFYDQEQSTWGFDPKDRGSWQVVYTETSIPTSEISRNNSQAESDFQSVSVSPRAVASLPSMERFNLNHLLGLDEALELPYELYETASDLKSDIYCGHAAHLIGGYPDNIQSDEMGLQCQLVSHGLNCGDASAYSDPRAAELASGASEWQLLLQIDSDEDANMMWGDCGRLYFWIKKSDLQRKHFADVWMILQCS